MTNPDAHLEREQAEEVPTEPMFDVVATPGGLLASIFVPWSHVGRMGLDSDAPDEE